MSSLVSKDFELSRFQPNLAILNEKRWNEALDRIQQFQIGFSAPSDDAAAELERLIKVIEYLSKVVESAAPYADIINVDIQNSMNNFDSRLNTMTSLQPAQEGQIPKILANLNNDATNLVNRIAPFATSLESARAAGQAFGRYRKKVETDTEALKVIRADAETSRQAIKQSLEAISLFRKELLEGDEDNASIKTKTTDAVNSIDRMLNEIEEHYLKITQGDSDSASIISQINHARDEATEKSGEISKELNDSNNKLKVLEQLYNEIIGYIDGDGKEVPGLKEQLTKRKTELESMADNYDTKFKGLVDQIEGLLPGATSAGLATAYNTLRTDAQKGPSGIRVHSSWEYSHWSVLQR